MLVVDEDVCQGVVASCDAPAVSEWATHTGEMQRQCRGCTRHLMDVFTDICADLLDETQPVFEVAR